MESRLDSASAGEGLQGKDKAVNHCEVGQLDDDRPQTGWKAIQGHAQSRIRTGEAYLSEEESRVAWLHGEEAQFKPALALALPQVAAHSASTARFHFSLEEFLS